MQCGVLAGVCAVVIGAYAYTARSGYLVSSSLNPAKNYCNLLVQGFCAGQLNLKMAAPPGLAQLANPYDPAAHAHYGVLDMSYYRGKLYLYFGVTPAVVLFWPYVALTSRYLLQKDAALIFCLAGFLASVGVLYALWQRYFAEVSIWVVAAGTLALGLATLMPSLLARCDIYEVATSCGYALTMVALAAVWKALHDSSHRGRWLAAASLAYGLAVGARPTLLFGAAILLVPVAQAWRERQKLWAVWLAAAGPIALIGLGLMVYNLLRFDNPFEFGFRYQLAGDRQIALQVFSPRYLWYNFRVYFLALSRWSGRFPFVHDAIVPARPAGHGRPDQTFGVLTSIPLVWLALAAPLAWRDHSGEERTILSGLLAAMVMLFGFGALTLGFCCYSVGRYELDFLPALVLLAVTGILSLERALAGRPVWRRAARWGWSLLLGLSVAFSLLASVKRCAEAHNNLAETLQVMGQVQQATEQYEQALRLNPDYAEAHSNLGDSLMSHGRVQDAIRHYEQALHLKPDYAEAHFNLGIALQKQGRQRKAIEHWKQALRINPDKAEAHYVLGLASMMQGNLQDGISQFEQAVRLKADYAEAHYNLGDALEQTGRLDEAIGHFEQALRIRADYADAHNNLGVALMNQGRLQEAIDHYEEALRIQPDYAQAQCNWANGLIRAGEAQEAIGHYEQALRMAPGFVEAHYNLALALEKTGRPQEAIQQYKLALRFRPGLVEAQSALARLQARQ